MSKLIKFSLVAVLSLGLMPNTSFAQDADDDVEEVIVTGSKIKKSVFDSSKPLEIISDAAIERTGLNNIGDILQSISSNDGNGCLLYTSPSPRDRSLSRMPSSA